MAQSLVQRLQAGLAVRSDVVDGPEFSTKTTGWVGC